MKDKEKQYITMKEMLTKTSFEPITNCNCNCKIESRIDYAVRNENKDGAFVDLLNQEIEAMKYFASKNAVSIFDIVKNCEHKEMIEEMAKISFNVVDNKTNKYPDLYNIALKEDWAKGLMYCDMDGFAINEDGNLVLLDECGNVAYCPKDRFTMVFKNSVVFSREEYEIINHNIEHLESVCNNLEKERNTLEEKLMDLRLDKHELMNEISEKDNKIALLKETIECIKFNVDFTRKETATEIITHLKRRKIIGEYELQKMAEKYGVELGE